MDTVFDCVVNYVHDVSDMNSFSLVSRTCYDVDAMTRKHVTAHLCYATPLRCRQRFPFIESLTLAGNPIRRSGGIGYVVVVTLAGNPHIVDLGSSPCNWDHNLTPWVQEIATSFKRLKVVRFQNLDVHDWDLELLARSRGETLRVLEIDSCSGFSTDGLLYIGKYCTNLRILSLENSSISEKDGEWLHELALHNNSIESLDFYNARLIKFDLKDLTLVAKNCSESLVSVKISEHYEFIDLVEFFSYAVKLEDFGGGRFGNNNLIGNNALGMNPILYIRAQRAKYKDFKFPPNLKYLALNHMGQKDIVLSFAHLITQFVYDRRHRHFYHHQHSLIENCPNLEVLYTASISNEGMEHLSRYCKNLRKLYVTNRTMLTEKGLFALALGCSQLESLHINLSCVTFEAMVHIGINLKKLFDLSMVLGNKGELGGLSNIGLSYIEKFGCNLRYLSLGYARESDAGLVELSFGCPKLQNLVQVVHFQNLDVDDSDLELLARTCGEKLMVLEMDSCSGFATDGLLYIGKYCTDMRILSLENSSISEKNGEWLHELALHSSSTESLNFYRTGLTKFDVKDLTLVAKNCSQSLVSVKISEHYEFIDLVEFFSYVVKLEDFGGGRFDDNNTINYNEVDTQTVYDRSHHYQHSLIEYCPNLEVLHTAFICNKGLEQLSEYRKNLRKLYVTDRTGPLTEQGISLKNLSNLSMEIHNKGVSMKDSVIDNGIRTLLIDCNKLERLSIYFQELRGLSDIGESDAGFVELSFGCPKLQNLCLKEAVREWLPLTEHRQCVRGLTDIITPSVRKELEKLKDYLRLWEVYPSSYREFEIRKLNEGYGVNLETHKCTCRWWDLTGIPCIHGVAAYAFFMKDPADGVSECYSKRAWQNSYSSFILPVHGQSMWVKSGLPPPIPPKQGTMPGRPKGKRQKHPSEVNVSNSQRVSRFGRTITCSDCYQKGHNNKGCKNETIDPPPKEMEQPVHMKEPVREANVQEYINEDEDPGQNVQEEELVQEPANANEEPVQMEDNV
ncbi:coronatine-insensitive protein 1-like protein [Tanacetum coccineum]